MQIFTFIVAFGISRTNNGTAIVTSKAGATETYGCIVFKHTGSPFQAVWIPRAVDLTAVMALKVCVTYTRIIAEKKTHPR